MTSIEAHLLIGGGLLLAALIFGGLGAAAQESQHNKPLTGPLMGFAACLGGMACIMFIFKVALPWVLSFF